MSRHNISTLPGNLQPSNPPLADSPIALLAWIYEKLVLWTDAYPWSDDEVLTWVSIYWFSRAGPVASIGLYYELAKADEVVRLPRTSVPVGLSFFAKDILLRPKAFLYAEANIVFESEHNAGGQFAAYERPDALADDLRRMLGRGPCSGGY
ncbi:Alpha/Beta hydrolase protein [Gloeopeniophorella convolvens]|nr:Alpha/Beta hydrolase protein [Gloeopeniophorella convolvens]